MKYVVALVSGMASPLSGKNLQGEAPHLKQLLDQGYSGKLNAGTKISTRDEYISLLPVLGYDPAVSYKGEGSLLAALASVHLEKEDVAFCCDLVTLRHAQEGYFFPKFGPKVILEKLPLSSLSDEEGKELIREINEQVGTESIVFYPVKNICHLMVWVGGKTNIRSFPPVEAVGKPIFSYLPKGDGANTLIRCMEVASQFLQQHFLNEERIAQEKPPVNGIWLSEPGKALDLPTWEDLYGIRGEMIAEDDFMKGIGQLAGLSQVEYQGAENQNFKERCDAKAKAAIKSLGGHDFVFIYIPVDQHNQAGALQTIDQAFLGPVMEHLSKNSDWKFLFMEGSLVGEFPGKMTYAPVEKEISFLVSSPGGNKKSGMVVKEGHLLMPRFIKGGSWE